MELEATWGRTVRVWWAYLWRGLIAAVVSMILGAIAGFVIGFVLGAIGAPLETIQVVCFPIGCAIGLAVSVVPMRMILGKDFGEFRLVLVSNGAAPPLAQPRSLHA